MQIENGKREGKYRSLYITYEHLTDGDVIIINLVAE